MSEKFNIRDFLNRIIWNKREKPNDYKIFYISRGAPGDVEEVTGDNIVKVYSRGFELREGKYIPFHRIVKIVNVKNNKIIFISKKYMTKI